MKFKVGDIVKIINNTYGQINQIKRIVAIVEPQLFYVAQDFGLKKWPYYDDEIELYIPILLCPKYLK